MPDAQAEVSRLDPGTVLCTGRSSVSVYDRNSGRRLWHDADGTQYATAPGRVYAVRADGLLHALDAATGRQLWSTAPEGTGPSTIMSADAAQVVLGSANGTLRGLDPAGRQLWKQNLYIPCAAGDRVYAFDQDRSLLALRAADGERIWRRDTPLSTTDKSTPLDQQALALIGGRLYCYHQIDLGGTRGGPLIAVDPADGGTLWSARPSTGLLNSFAVADAVTCYLDSGGLHGLDARTGRLRWQAGTDLGALSFLGAAGGMFLVGSVSQSSAGLHGFDPASGRPVWHYPVTGATGYWTGVQDSRGLYRPHRLPPARLPPARLTPGRDGHPPSAPAGARTPPRNARTGQPVGCSGKGGSVDGGASTAAHCPPESRPHRPPRSGSGPERGEDMAFPQWLRSRHSATQEEVMAVLESLELPAAVESIATAIDSARGPEAVDRSGPTSVRSVRRRLRSLAGRVTRLTAEQWYGSGVHVRAPVGNPDLWWSTAVWEQEREIRRQRIESFAAQPSYRTGNEKSKLARMLEEHARANEAHYQWHKNDVGPGAN
ncbi:PQQ-binding-like beta-propeller repeat protein [Kitasatospora setae]|uniref:Pyrrolo-quinoline quinone repeat domain-containing protein n=1 Tax=Kitasatospora setae (strain ATCC 33774 / DSM 43861 / JCM 3304 / KCC A-0304 / NBRC 14216 / KM-6054) TaxID=452652 RepID=E4N7E0_KITSK|nr:PQQ-binding-like beta-propeller repeat protein [Kitasatospora setae]BAJ27121.1 hypothetical protein KSE_12910 [Kitasatospora setae KM-6054]